MNLFSKNSINEILFEKKNKLYGAYAIRVAYGSTVFKSLGITTSSILSALFLVTLLLSKEVKEEVIVPDGNTDSLVIHPFDVTPPEKVDPPVADPPRDPSGGQRQNNVTSFNIRNNAVDTTNVTPNDNLTSNTTSSVAATGTGTSTTTATNTTSTTFTTDIGGGGTYEPIKFPEVFPDFPELKKFWAENLRYPGAAREAGIQGKVAINFVVDEQGNVVNCKILKGLGYGCEEEVLRVMKLMPKWKPGTMSGRPVKVSLSQAIDFKLQ